MNIKFPLTLLLLFLLGTAACIPEESAGATSGAFTRLFVSTEGDDTNPGTREKPWKTIAKGLDKEAAWRESLRSFFSPGLDGRAGTGLPH